MHPLWNVFPAISTCAALTAAQPDLSGRVAFVTGGASGVGLRTFRSLARMGARVYLADINETGGRAAVEELQREGRDVLFLPLDLGTMRSAKNAADTFGQLEEHLHILGTPMWFACFYAEMCCSE